MSRRLVSTAVLTSGMTASARVSEEINRTGYPVREPTRATLLSATWPGGVFLLRPTVRARVACKLEEGVRHNGQRTSVLGERFETAENV